MNAAEHKAEAETLLTAAARHLDTAEAPFYVEAAKVHATLATIPDPAPVDPPADPLWDSPRYKAASLLEQFAVGEMGDARERTIARLILGDLADAADIAVHALHAARDAGGGNKVKAVEAAITTLGIELDAS